MSEPIFNRTQSWAPTTDNKALLAKLVGVSTETARWHARDESYVKGRWDFETFSGGVARFESVPSAPNQKQFN